MDTTAIGLVLAVMITGLVEFAPGWMFNDGH
jgi:hypothetical protein